VSLDDVIGAVTMQAGQALARIGPDSVAPLIPVIQATAN